MEFDLKAELLKLQQENAVLKAKANQQRTLSCKVTEKGGVSVYGLGRFPVTLYKSQWMKLINSIEAIKQFIVDNDSKLASKDS